MVLLWWQRKIQAKNKVCYNDITIIEKEDKRMNAVNTNENKTKSVDKSKFRNALKKILLWGGIIIGGGILLVALYQILQVLFVAVVLFIAWICPKRWW